MVLNASEYENYLRKLTDAAGSVSSDIAKYRKASYRVRLNGLGGDNIHVVVRQKSHDFDFGCNALKINGFDTSEKNAKYESMLSGIFNLVTTTMCFSVYSKHRGIYSFEKDEFRRPSPYRVLDFAAAHNMRAKAQPLIADSWSPEWMKGMNRIEADSCYREWLEEVAGRFGDRFDMFDMVNEAFLCKGRTPDFPLYDDNLSFVSDAFRMGRTVFGEKTRLGLNENSNVNYVSADRYLELAKRLIDEGNAPDSIGFQFHTPYCHMNNLPPEGLIDTYSRFAELGISLYISEVTLPSKFEECPKLFGEQLQAAIAEQYYRLWFAMKNMNGIIYWNLVDGAAWQSEGDWLGCLADSNLQEKASYRVLKKLICEEWHTEMDRFVQLNRKGAGVFEFTGYAGEYDIDMPLGVTAEIEKI